MGGCHSPLDGSRPLVTRLWTKQLPMTEMKRGACRDALSGVTSVKEPHDVFCQLMRRRGVLIELSGASRLLQR